MPETVVAALSGGVDSATAAALLVEAGHRVIGVTLRLHDAGGTAGSLGGRCCGPRDLEDARRVAAHLGIPFYVFDLREEFGRRVVDDFVAEYAAGRTPNPCVRCNEHVKFGPLLRCARALGAGALATGHYARLVSGPSGLPRLLRGRDARKDQSYFLFGVPVADLHALRFPLGDLCKDEVRTRARSFGLPNADKPDSQEICFVPDGDHVGFVERRSAAAPAPGDVVTLDGRRLGGHRGVHGFTVGQRRGLGALGGARYVVALDAKQRLVVVGDREDLLAHRVRVGGVRFLGTPPAAGMPIAVQVRHRHAPRPGRLCATGRVDIWDVAFEEAERACAPGQAAVFYDGDQVLGGGFIEAAFSDRLSAIRSRIGEHRAEG